MRLISFLFFHIAHVLFCSLFYVIHNHEVKRWTVFFVGFLFTFRKLFIYGWIVVFIYVWINIYIYERNFVSVRKEKFAYQISFKVRLLYVLWFANVRMPYSKFILPTRSRTNHIELYGVLTIHIRVSIIIGNIRKNIGNATMKTKLKATTK